jgi:AraC family transcriptional regulator
MRQSPEQINLHVRSSGILTVAYHTEAMDGILQHIFDEKNHVLFVFLGESSVEGGVEREWKTFKARTGDIILLPAGSKSTWKIGSRNENLLYLRLDAAEFDALFNAEPLRARVGLRPAIMKRDLTIEGIARTCLFEVLSPAVGTDRLIESKGITLSIHLLRNYSGMPRAEKTKALSMAPYRLRLAMDYVERTLEGSLHIEDMASEAGLSAHHFARCFKSETGYTPYGYITERRIERSKELMLKTGMSLAEIALACGFCSQPNFTQKFRKLVGMPPGVWRRAHSR